MSEFTININHSEINGQVQVGDYNTINLGKSTLEITEKQWDEVRRFLAQRRNAFEYDSKEYELVCEAEYLSKKKSKGKFKDLILSNRDVFINSVLGTTLTAAMKEIIELIIH